MNAQRNSLTRRSFLLAGGAGLLATVPLARAGLRAVHRRDEIFLSASDDAAGRHYVTACDLHGRALFSVEVETRCHGVALHASQPGRAIVVARRPGTLAYDVDVHAGAVRHRRSRGRAVTVHPSRRSLSIEQQNPALPLLRLGEGVVSGSPKGQGGYAQPAAK